MNSDSTNPSSSNALQKLLDKDAIRDCLLTYARAIDRCDRKLLETVYWPDAWDDHVVFSGSAKDFVDWVIPAVQAMEQTMHSFQNILIDMRDDEARVESYFTAYHRLLREGKPFAFTLGGRYLDRMVKRKGEWRILDRSVKMDWLQEDRSPPRSGDNVLGIELTTNRWPDDSSYLLFKSDGADSLR